MDFGHSLFTRTLNLERFAASTRSSGTGNFPLTVLGFADSAAETKTGLQSTTQSVTTDLIDLVLIVEDQVWSRRARSWGQLGHDLAMTRRNQAGADPCSIGAAQGGYCGYVCVTAYWHSD